MMFVEDLDLNFIDIVKQVHALQVQQFNFLKYPVNCNIDFNSLIQEKQQLLLDNYGCVVQNIYNDSTVCSVIFPYKQLVLKFNL